MDTVIVYVPDRLESAWNEPIITSDGKSELLPMRTRLNTPCFVRLPVGWAGRLKGLGLVELVPADQLDDPPIILTQVGGGTPPKKITTQRSKELPEDVLQYLLDERLCVVSRESE